MWDTFKIESTETSTKFGINEENEPITYNQFLTLLKDSEDFRNFYNRYLEECGYKAFFWENKPITRQTLDNDYECNLINSNFLASRSPDPQTFSSYFREDKSIACFPNLGNDARLIAPCPLKEHSIYTHIGSFVRNAGNNQIHEFWKEVSKETLNQISDEPSWLSTSGLGVFWLHVRIDSYPKYYQTAEYKHIP